MDIEEVIPLIERLVVEKTNSSLTDLQRAIISDCWLEPRTTYEKIAHNYGYSVKYLKQDIGPKLWKLLSDICGEKVKKSNFKAAIYRLANPKSKFPHNLDNNNNLPQKSAFNLLVSNNTDFIEQNPKITSLSKQEINNNCSFNLKEAPKINEFWGRTQELITLKQWLVEEHSTLVMVLGMGGIGKTYLSVKLAHEVKQEFEYVIWLSLAHKLSYSDRIIELLTFLKQDEITDFPANTQEQLDLLISYLSRHRCLIIIDNLETILDNNSIVSNYRSGCEEYSKLFQVISEHQHRSCLLITSREKPQDINIIQERSNKVCCYSLSGLSTSVGKKLLESKGCFWQSEDHCNFLLKRYLGNPLALKLACITIKDLFNGNISNFIAQESFVFSGITTLLEQQISRLSFSGQTIIYWLAISVNPISLIKLKQYFYPQMLNSLFLNEFQILWQKGLLEKQENLFVLKPIFQEYLIEKLIKISHQEIITETLLFLNTHALLLVSNDDYTKDCQIEFILNPLINKCIESLGSKQNLELKLKKILTQLQNRNPPEPGYAAGNILNILCQLDTSLEKEDLSNLVIWQADLQKINLCQVNFSGSDLDGSVFSERLTNVLSLNFGSDGKLLATGDSSGEVRLWSVKEQKLKQINPLHAGWVFSVAFSPNNQLLASAGSDRTVIIWDINQNCLRRKLIGHEQRVSCVVFSPCGNILATSSSDHQIKLWEVATGICLKTLAEHKNHVWSLAFSSNGKILASGSEDGTIKLWDVVSGKCQKTLIGHKKWIRSVAFHPQVNILASGGGERIVKLWDIDRGECIKNLEGHTERIRSVNFSPDGCVLASGSGDCTIRLWNYPTGECVRTLHGHSSRLTAVAFSPDSQLLASGGEDRSIRLWNVKTGQSNLTWQGYASWFQSVAFSPHGQILVSSSENNAIELWDLEANSEKSSVELSGHKGWVYQVTFSPNQNKIASCSSDRTIKLWDVENKKCLKTFLGHTRWIRTLAFSPNGKILVSGGGDRTVRVWDIITDNCLLALSGHESEINSVAFSPDGITVASGSKDKTICLWNLNTGKLDQTFSQHTSWVQSVAFSPDGQTLASGSCDRTICLWDVNTGKCLQTLLGHTSWVQSIAFSPDGQTLASGSYDSTIKLWDINTGECLQTLLGHTSWVQSIAFSPDGQTLASGGQDESIKIWDITTGKCYQTLRHKRLLEGAQIKGVKGLNSAQIKTLKALGAVDDN